MSYQTARNNAATQQAYDLLNNHFTLGKKEGMELFEKIRKLVIVDYMVHTHHMHFAPSEMAGRSPAYVVLANGSEHHFKIHPHALGQMATQTEIPIRFIHTLTNGEDWERRELSDLLTERFNKLDFKQRGGGRDRFLNRVVDGEVRGFMSRMYKRHLSSGPILQAFVRGCSRFGAMPASVLATDLSFTLRCFLPHVFEPADGEFIGIGCSCSNSDFGAGTLRLGLCVLRIKNRTVSYVKDTHSELHRGKADNSADTSVELSMDTIEKQVVAKQSEIDDIVTATLHPDKVNEFLDTIAKAVDKKISWYKLEKYLQGKLNKEELEELEALLEKGDESGELPSVSRDVDGASIANLWWASSAVSKMAERQTSLDRKGDLQDVAGALLLR